jgi:diguanylate cyclase (GGDEF)-like protein
LSELSFLSILSSISDGALLLEPGDWSIEFANEAAAEYLGLSVAQLRGQRLERVVASPQSIQRVADCAQRVLAGDEVNSSLSLVLATERGTRREFHARFCSVEMGKQSRVCLLLQPVSRSAADSNATRRDPLTGMPDREFLLSRVTLLLRGERAADRNFAVLFVDLDNFKRVNDQYGHLAGDCVLRELGARLSSCVREGDHATRFGGDEFVVLLEGVVGRDEIDSVVARIHDELARPIVVDDGVFALSASIGVAQAEAHHQTAEDLLNEADRQMYATKRAIA